MYGYGNVCMGVWMNEWFGWSCCGGLGGIGVGVASGGVEIGDSVDDSWSGGTGGGVGGSDEGFVLVLGAVVVVAGMVLIIVVWGSWWRLGWE